MAGDALQRLGIAFVLAGGFLDAPFVGGLLIVFGLAAAFVGSLVALDAYRGVS